MKRLLLLCLILLFLASFAEARLVQGKTLDPQGKPISSVLVSDGKQYKYSSEQGEFSLSTEADSLSFSRLGFKTRKLAAIKSSGSVVLEPEALLLPKVVVSESAWNVYSAPADRVALPIDPDRHYYSPAEILATTPSLSSSDVRLPGENQSVSILGNLPRHSLIIVDGIALNPGGESYDLSLIDTNNIESIELIKNNASVYGGGSAIGGILNIRTRQGKTSGSTEFSINSEIGSFGYAKNSLSFAAALKNWELRLGSSHLNTNNDFKYKMPDWWSGDSLMIRENNARRQNSLSGSLAFRSGITRLSLQTDYVWFHRQLPGTVNFTEVYRHAYLDGHANRNSLGISAGSGKYNADLLAWLNLDGALYDNTNAPLPVYVSRYRQNLLNTGLRGSLGANFTLAQGLSLNAGTAAEFGHEHYRNLNLINPANDLDHSDSFANISLKTGLQQDWGLWLLDGAGAVRLDRARGQNNPSWRLEGSLRHIGFVESSLGGTWGSSFALPSPYDLYWKGDSQAIGNPNLSSEKSRGWQLWLENRIGGFHLRGAWHANEIDSLIQWRQVQMFGNVWKPFNVGKAQVKNLELETGLKPWDWLDLSASMLLTKTLDLSSNPPETAPHLMYTPDFSYGFKLGLNWPFLRFWSQYSHTGEQFTTPDNLAGALPSHSLLDCGISTVFHIWNWELSPHFSIHNLLNKQYSVYAYVPQPGISFQGGISLRIKD